MSYTAKVSNGKLHVQELIEYQLELQELEGQTLELELKKKVGKKRSNPFNRYYFGVVVRMIYNRLKELGYLQKSDLSEKGHTLLSPDDVHEFLKGMFNMHSIFGPDGTVVRFGGSTASLDNDGFKKYVENIRTWASSVLSIDIPDPITSGYFNGYQWK